MISEVKLSYQYVLNFQLSCKFSYDILCIWFSILGAYSPKSLIFQCAY